LVSQPIDESKIVTLRATTHPLAQPRFDQGAVPDSFPVRRVLLMLNRPAEREAALLRFLSDVHSKNSPTYHHWLTPEQFGETFGPVDSDIQAASSWLASHGFQVPRISKSKTLVEFSGTAAQLREAFHTEIHQYTVNGETHYANSTDLSVPAALAPLIRGVTRLDSFGLESYVESLGQAAYSPATKRFAPLFTNPDGRTNFFAVAPEDFVTEYNVAPLYTAGVNGTGQTIGVIAQGNIDLALPNAFRTLFGLPANAPQVVIDGNDPGEFPRNLNPYFEVELAGAIAPAATVNLYLAQTNLVQSAQALAALRAVDDNQASVLVAGFGECEQLLENAGNQFWSSLWEQAAAQGQSVFVANGNTGPAACDAGLSAIATNVGLAVNGIASTPWDTAVGATDFFYSDFASGAPSAPSFWNQSNDSSFGSLKAPLPEQPWDDALGLNAVNFFASNTISLPASATGGGASSCSQAMDNVQPVVCTGGYAKPSWQNAPGVPADNARDVPDIALFGGNGSNFSSYAVCAEPGDCTGGGQPTVTLLGGTAASASAMAGIAALVNQKFGRQGQANFTLYALARQFPAVFHDVTMGTNDVVCIKGTPDCIVPLPENAPFNLDSYGVFAAGPGYDQASGIGSFDANALVSNWTKPTFIPTSTTLSLSPTSIVHGSPVMFTATVTASSGSGMPGGDVNISTTSTSPIRQSGAIPLSSGTASESVNFFPGGTYQVFAEYLGDGVFASSGSSPVSLTVTPEPSVVTPIVRLFPGAANVASGQQVPFGTRALFEATPSGATSQLSGLATGSVTFTDGPATLQTMLDSAGTAVVPVSNLALGAHSVSVSYSGDASFNSSSGGPLNFTVVQGTPSELVSLSPEPAFTTANGPGTLPAGSSLTISVRLGTGGGVAPTGSVTISLGSSPQTVALAPFGSQQAAFAFAQATFSNLQVGTFTVSANYAGDANWTAASRTLAQSIAVVAANPVPTTAALTATPTAITSPALVTLVATVQAANSTQGAPGGLVEFDVDGFLIGAALLKSSGPATSTASITLPSAQLLSGSIQLTASYSDPSLIFGPSTSPPVTITNTPSDFRMSFTQSQLIVPAGQSGTAMLSLAGIGGSTVSVNLACVASSGSVGCGLSPSTTAVPASVALNFNAFAILAAQNPPVATNRWPRFPGYAPLAIALLLVLSLFLGTLRTSRKWRFATATGLAALVLLFNSCGGGHSSTIVPPPVQKVPAATGTYFVVVTAIANGVSHNAKLTVVVQ
jgi:hypothetical protein